VALRLTEPVELNWPLLRMRRKRQRPALWPPQIRQADAERRALGRWARLRAAWRGGM